MNKIKDKKSVRGDRIIIGLFVLIIITILLIIYFSTNYINRYTNLIQENIESRLFAECRVIQKMISLEQLQSYRIPEDMEREDYKKLQTTLTSYAEEHELMFVYYMRLTDDGRIQYIIDSDPNPETHYGLDHFEEPYDLVMEAFSGHPTYNLVGEYEPGWEGVMSAYIPIYDNNGDVIAVAGVDIDDTEIAKRERETYRFTFIAVTATIVLGITSLIFISRFRKKAKAANEASIVKGQFLSKMSHEIRTPMNAIMGFSRMAKNTKDLEKINEYLDNIGASSDYLLELINGILDISKIEANKMSLNLEKVSIHKVLKDINVILISQTVKKSQKFDMDIAVDIPKYLYCDEMRLKQIIVNLTANAIKFTPLNGNILVKVYVTEIKNNSCNLEFIVKDNGIGIKEENIGKLFMAFEQGDGSITRKYGGTGLGLAISKHFIEMMGGSISVVSKVGEGSTFKFNIWLDIVPESEILLEEDKKGLVEQETIDCKGMVFLVAEDSLVNQIIEKDILEGFGAVVEFANNGIECIEMFSQNPDKYNIIFMDIQMPEMDGLAATRKIRSSAIDRARDIPIIAMTAEIFQEDINNALNAGMNDHLGKPLNINEIIIVIKKTLGDKGGN